MKSTYIHARSRDVAAGREAFPMVALGWQIESQKPGRTCARLFNGVSVEDSGKCRAQAVRRLLVIARYSLRDCL